VNACSSSSDPVLVEPAPIVHDPRCETPESSGLDTESDTKQVATKEEITAAEPKAAPSPPLLELDEVVSSSQQPVSSLNADQDSKVDRCMMTSSLEKTFDIIDYSKDLLDVAKNSTETLPEPLAEAEPDLDAEKNPKEDDIEENNEDEDEDCSCTTTGSRSPTPVHFEITPKGVKVISDKESFL
jgi:hypothetical protein